MRVSKKLILLVLLIWAPSKNYAQTWTEDYSALRKKATAQKQESNWESAIESLQAAYNLALDHLDYNRAFYAKYQIALLHLDRNDPQTAANVLEKMYVEFKNELDAEKKMLLSNRLGWAYFELLEFDNALHHYDRSIQYAKQINDSSWLARSLTGKGNVKNRLAEFEEALALKIRARSYAEHDPITKAYVDLQIYATYRWMGNTVSGLPYLFESYKLYKKTNYYSWIGQCLYLLASYYIDEDDYTHGLAYLNEGLKLATRTNNQSLLATLNDEMADLYFKFREYDHAVTLYLKSYKYYQQTGQLLKIDETRLGLARAYTKLKNFEEAEQLLTASYQFHKKQNNALQMANTLRDLASLEADRNRYTKARDYINEALSYTDSSSLSMIPIWGYPRLLSYPDSIVLPHEKLQIGRKFYTISKNFSTNSFLNATINFARLFEKTNPDSAFFYAEKALHHIDNWRKDNGSNFVKTRFLTDYVDFYYEVGSWNYQYFQDKERAFQLFEEAKSHTLFDQLVESNFSKLLTPEHPRSIKVLEIQKTIDRLTRQLETTSDQAKRELLKAQLIEAELNYENEVALLKQESPDWQDLPYPEAATLKKAQALLDDKTVLLSYALLHDRLFIFVVTQNEDELIELPPTPDFEDRIVRYIDDYRMAITSSATFDELAQQSIPLLEALIKPVQSYLEQYKQLVIIPDGAISLLPFEALRMNDQFLVENYTIKYLPSVSIYQQIHNPHRNTSKQLFAVAGSGFELGGDLFEISAQNEYPTLPYALAEIDTVAHHFETAVILRNEHVTEANVKQQNLEDFRYLHFATHGDINEFSPNQSGLILSKKINIESLFGEDGFLNASEISHLKLNADMVVLSACNTGTGKVINGEGVMGLQRSFLVAGASSVLTSLWGIYDRSTPLFMGRFYHYLNEYEREEFDMINRIKVWANWYTPDLIDYKTRALRDAKLFMLKHPYYNHPVYWAPFVLTGK